MTNFIANTKITSLGRYLSVFYTILQSIEFHYAVAKALGEAAKPVLTRFDVASVCWGICKSGSYQGWPLKPKPRQFELSDFNALERKLINSGLLRSVSNKLQKAPGYTLLGAPKPSQSMLACALDPHCYVSHLSAMEFQGFTNRLPETLYVSSPPPQEWAQLSEKLMRDSLGDAYDEFLSTQLPKLSRSSLGSALGPKLHRFSSSNRGAFKNIRDQGLRVSTVGRIFLDMLREPDLCGGISHVLDVFPEHGTRHAELIIDELDRHGGDIDKVRGGFLLEHLCRIHGHPRINAWTILAKRGGSRKLDSKADYSAEFSERWSLSINTTLPTT